LLSGPHQEASSHMVENTGTRDT